MRPEPLQKQPQRLGVEGNAPGGRRELVPGNVDEHRAAATCHSGSGVVADLNDEVVERIRAPQSVRVVAFRYPDRPIVTTVARILAPSVIGPDAPHRKPGTGPWGAISPPPQSPQHECAAWRAAVAFALVRLDAAPAERCRQS